MRLIHGSSHRARKSSARKFGGVPEDYQKIHDFFDESKAFVADFRHTALRHHAEGIYMAERIFGTTILNSDGKAVPVRYIGEQHVKEDLGRIPSFQDWIQELPTRPWMYGQKLAKTQELSAAILTLVNISLSSRGCGLFQPTSIPNPMKGFRMAKKVIIEYFGFRGEGSTAKEAKLVAGRKITGLHVGHWSPELIEWRGEAALVYRTLDGWEYTFIQHDGGPLRTRGISIGDGTFAGTVRAARRHLVDVAWRLGDPVDLFPEWFDNREDRRDIIGRREWQIRYQRLKAEGKSDGEAHQLASVTSAPRDVLADTSRDAMELSVAL